MSKSWGESVATHRHAVRDAIKNATWSLVHEHGATGVSMSRIADRVEISRATLYRYFSDVDSILVEWHADKIHSHVTQLRQAADGIGDPVERLTAVLTCYATIAGGEPRGGELATLLHQGAHLARAEQQVLDLFTELLASAAQAGAVRSDVPPAELARYCLYALAAADDPARPGSGLVRVVLAGLRP